MKNLNKDLIITLIAVLILMIGVFFQPHQNLENEQIKIKNEHEQDEISEDEYLGDNPIINENLNYLNLLCNTNGIQHISSFDIRVGYIIYYFYISNEQYKNNKETFVKISKEYTEYLNSEKEIIFCIFSNENVEKCLSVITNGKIEIEY